MRLRLVTVSVSVLVIAACGSPGRHDNGGGGGGSDGGSSNVVHVPDPGSQAMSFNWADVEPNDTPDEATPVGTSADPSGNVETWVDDNTIGGADKEDYFVFRSGPAAGKFTANMCWTTAGNLMDLHLYKVVDGQAPTEVGSATDPTTQNCKNLQNVAIEANTKYLVELRSSAAAPDHYNS